MCGRDDFNPSGQTRQLLGANLAVNILEWKTISHEFDDALLLGNGASIALWKDFAYSSLLDKGQALGCLSAEAAAVFRAFDTTDFEMVLRLLRQAGLVNERLGMSETITRAKHDEVRNGLVETVRRIHATQQQVRRHLPAIAGFLKRFRTVFSLNYDLLMYWAILVGNEPYGGRNRLKDFWLRLPGQPLGVFPDEYDWLRERDDGTDGCTVVLYPHGNLSIVKDDSGQEWKVYCDSAHNLLNAVLSRWINNYRPLFVSEGETGRKMQAIRRSPYLKSVYERELTQVKNTLVIFGWSAGEQDSHILDAILKRRPRTIAIGIHDKSEDSVLRWDRFADEVRRYRGAASTEIVFFDSDSDGCWSRCAD
jgi:hypothetical protein